MEFAVTYIIGCIFGALVAVLIMRSKSVGTLIRVVSPDPDEKPYLFLELNEDVNDLIMKRKYVFMTVRTSQK